ncbi:MAG: CBS domain-containing protein [Deltaproteobacteria bacterium]|nr:CBS domain-containing protein [Deltaproteobacteria bacterium]
MSHAKTPTTIITCHINPDYDALASMVGALKLYPDAGLLLPGGQGKRTTSPFVKGLLSQLPMVKAKELDFKQVERLVVVDTRQKDRIGFATPILNNPNLEIHLYDHHPDANGDLKGQVSHISIVGATVTILSELLKERNLDLSPEEATMLSLGLYEDTGSFTFSSTTPRDMRAAAFFLEKGAQLEVVSSLTSQELGAEQLSLLNELIGAAETREVRGKALAVAMAYRERHVDEVSTLAPRMMEILDLDTLFILVQMDNLVQLVARSRKGGLNVGEVAKALEGGGHHGAAAAAFKGESLDEVRERLEDAIKESVGKLFQAGSIMVHPPICLSELRPISEAMDMMARYGLHVILAEDAQGKVSGIILEQSVSKAIYHKLTGFPVKDFMLMDFVTVSTEATFYEVKKIIVDHRQRILPVVDNQGKAVGVITRSDLLHILAAEAGEEEGKISSHTPFDKNLSNLMADKLPPEINDLLAEMGQLAGSFGSSLYLVGGTVRDLIMLKSIKDLDLTVTGELGGFIKALAAKHPGSTLKLHPRFKTATLTLSKGTKLDFSSARVEYYEYPGALPVVRHASIQLDLQRRDFTVNTLAVSLNAKDYGKLLDYYRGYQDIKEGLIRVLHSLSFVEDPTRVFRAVRFENRLGFRISRMTGALISNAVTGGFVKNISMRRIMGELKIICEEEEPASAFERLGDFGLLKCFSHDLRVTRKHKELFKKVDRVKDWFRLTFTSNYSPMWLVYFLALTYELDQDTLFQLADHLDDYKKMLRALISERPTLERVAAAGKKYPQDVSLKPSEADTLFGNLSWPGILYVMARSGTGPIARAGASFLTSYRRVKPETTGDDLLKMGFKEGPSLQKALNILRHARQDGLVGSKDEEKKFVRLFLAGKAPEQYAEEELFPFPV